MQIFYRVLKVVPDECSVEVRYWSDEVSEIELRTDPEDRNDPPLRCRSDYNINVKPNVTPAQLHNIIMDAAPAQWLEMKGMAKSPEIDTSLSQLQSMVGATRTEEFTQDAPAARTFLPPHRDPEAAAKLPRWRRRMPFSQDQEIDISELLDGVTQPPEPVSTTVHLYRRTTKTNSGAWGYPSNFKMADVQYILMPFLQRMHTDIPGILNPSTVYFESSNVFVRKWTVDSVATALTVKAFMADDSIPESKAMRELSKAHHDNLGTTYSHEWKLTREPA